MVIKAKSLFGYPTYSIKHYIYENGTTTAKVVNSVVAWFCWVVDWLWGCTKCGREQIKSALTPGLFLIFPHLLVKLSFCSWDWLDFLLFFNAVERNIDEVLQYQKIPNYVDRPKIIDCRTVCVCKEILERKWAQSYFFCHIQQNAVVFEKCTVCHIESRDLFLCRINYFPKKVSKYLAMQESLLQKIWQNAGKLEPKKVRSSQRVTFLLKLRQILKKNTVS